MIDLAQISIRVGGNPDYLNVDRDHSEIGYLQISASGNLTLWAHDLADRSALEELRRVVEPVVMALISR